MERESPNTDSKIMVASILSSMAAGGSTPITTPSSISFYSTTGTTPTLTPTTLASLEGFIEYENQAQDLSKQSGFVPPVINHKPIVIVPQHIQNEMAESCDDSADYSDPEWAPKTKRSKINTSRSSASSSTMSPNPNNSEDDPSAQYLLSVRGKGPRRHTGPRPKREQLLSKEEENKRMVRRERNKIAAAKCRQRVVKITKELLEQSDNLEEQKVHLESDIERFKVQRDQLEFLLKVHENSGKCNRNPEINQNEEHIHARPSSLSLLSSNVTTELVTPSRYILNTPSGLDMSDIHTGLTPIVSVACGTQAQQTTNSSPEILTPSILTNGN